MFLVLLLIIYLSFILDFFVWPIPSEVSTGSQLETSKSISSATKYQLLGSHAIVLTAWVSPVVSIFIHQSEDNNSLILLQWIGLLIAILGRALTISGSLAIRKYGLSSIIKSSVFRYSRHPILTGLHITLAGLILSTGTWLLWALYFFTLYFFHTKVLLEEKNLLAQYGNAYSLYKTETPRYLITEISGPKS